MPVLSVLSRLAWIHEHRIVVISTTHMVGTSHIDPYERFAKKRNSWSVLKHIPVSRSVNRGNRENEVNPM